MSTCFQQRHGELAYIKKAALEGVMRIRRAMIIPAILALGMTGAVVAGSALPAASSTHAHVVAGAHMHS